MKVTDPRLWIAAMSTGAVLWVSLDAIGRTSPGPLTAVHDRDPQLAGRRSCAACHGGWFETMSDACLACHELIGAQLEDGRGLHGSLGAERASTCASCHSEHHGAEFEIVNRQSFARAGVPDPSGFDHGIVGFEMEGEHLRLGCVECHEHADAEVLPEGARRFLGLEQGCASCHEDSHEGRMVLACADCHGQRSFDELEAKGHDRHLPLLGGHADVGCRTCHEDGSSRALEQLGSGARSPARVCADCHESPHRAAIVEATARLVGSSAGTACVTCHEHEHDSFADERLTVTRAQHAGAGFPLDVPHDRAGCADCHDPGQADFAARHPGRSPDDCRACHLDPHGGQFDAGGYAAVGCVGCHDRERFEPHAFSIEQHGRTGLPLSGAHLDADCSACHRSGEEGSPRAFAGTESDCAACHDDPHGGAFDELAAGGPDAALPNCAHCHGTTAFADVPADRFDHGHFTGFPVRGAHAQTDCESCHPRADEADQFGRTFGRVAEHFGRFEGCTTCHVDPHRGGFDRDGLPERVEDRDGCARCHVETSFRTFPHGFDHRLWTGFALDGGHAAADCSACHEPWFEPDDAGRTWGPASGTGCADCHADPHAGQFHVRGRTDCARCHRGAERFADVEFDHELESRFPLGEQHRGVECGACHRPFQHGEKQIVRYRPLGRECVDCHGSNNDPLRRRRTGR